MKTKSRRHGKEDGEKGRKLLDFPRKNNLSALPEKQTRKKILVVDDEPHMVRLLRLNLEPEGYEVIEATDGDEAYVLTVENKPDIVLLDVIVPKKSGIEVCKAIKGNASVAHIPVILITARGEGMRKAGLASGADLFLTKPFSPLRLLAEIRRIANKEG